MSVIAIYRQLMSLGCGKLGNHMLRAHYIASFLGLVFSLSLITPCEGQDGASLFHQMQRVLGGKAKIAAINRFEQCVRAEAWDETGKSHGVVYKRTRWTKPTVLRLDQVGAGDTYVLFFNGVSGWEILPDKGLVELTGDELAFAEGYAKGVDINLWLADEDINNLLASSKDHVISISSKGDPTHRTDITLNEKTLLPVSESSISLTDASHPVEMQKRQFEDWKTFDGVKFPRRIINFHHGRKVADIQLLELELNAAMNLSDLSRRPENLKPQMSGCGN